MSLSAAVVERQRDVDALEAEVAVVAARLNQDHADLVALTARALEHERWSGDGIRSPEHWLVLHAGLSPSRAGDVVRLARRSPDLPTTVSAMGAGQLSVDQAAVVARYAPSSHEASIGELAPMTTVPQLRRALSRYQFAEPTSTDAAATNAANASGRDESEVPGTYAFAAKAPQLSMSYGDGRFLLRYSAPADVGALVEQAVREAKDALFTAGQTDASYADGLAEVASRSLNSVQSSGSKGRSGRLARYRVYVHLSTDGAWVGGRGAIPASLAAKFTCDGIIQPVWEVGGVPVSVGRRQRIAPDRARRLLQDRDRGCVFPGCTATRFLEVHHLDHWKDGGATDLDRQVCLCPHHHDAHHRGDYTITGHPGHPGHPERLDGLEGAGPDGSRGGWGLVFTTARGLRIGGPPAVPADRAEADREPRTSVAEPYRGPTGERLQGRWLDLPPNRPALTVVPDSQPESLPDPDPMSDPDLVSDPDLEPDPDPNAGASPRSGPAPPGEAWPGWSAFDDWDDFDL